MLLRKTNLIVFITTFFCFLSLTGNAQSGSCVASISPVSEAFICPGGTITLKANTGTNLRYQWFLNNSPLSNTPTTSATYPANSAGTYYVKVTSSTNTGCTGAISEAVTIRESTPPPAAIFTLSTEAPQCSGTPITFTVADPNPDYTYKWDFGDETSGTGITSTHSFYSESVDGQTFTVTLETVDILGCSSTSENTVTVKPGPVVKLTNDRNFTNCLGGPLVLTVNDASQIQAGETYTYIIDWGDNKTAENYSRTTPPINLTHEYAAGVFKLKYKIQSTLGCTITKEYTIENRNSFIMNATNGQPKTQCVPYTFQFNLIDFEGNHPSTNYLIDFGDGSKKTYSHAQLLALKEQQRTRNLSWTVEHEYKTSSCTATNGEFMFAVTPINECKIPPTSKIPLVLNPATPVPDFRIQNPKACAGIPTLFSNLTAENKVFECNKNTRYIWDWDDDKPNTETKSRINTEHIYDAPGTYEVTLKVLNDCSPSEVKKQIVVIYPPKADFATTIGPITACVETTVRTTNNSTGNITGFTWTVIPNRDYRLAPGSTLLDREPTFIFTKAGSYHVRLTASNECKNDTISQKIFFKDKPTVTLPATQNYCGNEPPTLTFGPANAKHVPTYQEYNSAISAYLWEVEGGSYSFTSSTTAASKNPVIQFTSNATYTVKITATNECGNSVSATQTIKVNYTGINTITLGQTSYCSGTPVALITGTVPPAGTSIIWQSHTKDDDFRMTTGIADAANYNPGVLPEDTWFRRILRSGECDNISEIIKVTVSQPITNNLIFESQDLCARSTPELLTGSDPKGGNGQYMYIWESSTDNNIFKAVTGTNPNNLRDYQPGEIQDPTWFRRRVTSGNCAESVSPAVQISVTPGVTENTIGTAQRICIGTTAAPLIGTNATGGNNTIKYLWEISFQSGSGGFEPAPNINDQKDYQPSDVTRDTWFRRTIVSGGCKDISRAVKITVDKTIENNIISAAQTICTGTKPAVLSGTTHTGGNDNFTYEWEMSLDGIVYITALGVSNLKDFSPPALTQSTWYRRIIYSNPCLASESEPILIKVLSPITQNTLTLDQTVCAGVIPETITGSDPKGSSGAYTYLWEMSREDKPQSFGPAPGKNSEAAYTPPALTATTYYRRTVYAAPCQQVVSNSIKVQVNPLPPVPTTADAITCVGSPATLTASGTNVDFAWYTEATGGVPVLTGPTYITPPITEKATYYVESQRAGCVSARVPVQVTTYNTVADAGEDVTIIKGNKVGLKASGGSKYTWTPASSLNNADVTNPIASPQETTTYRVIVETPEGCTSTDEVTVTVIPRIIPANGITPNGDGANDTWVIKNIEHYPEAEIEIFNRWGNKIFTSIGYSTPWDGTFNGQPMPVAAYYFIIKLNKDEKPLSGNITLIR